jgi:hypothetical protein
VARWLWCESTLIDERLESTERKLAHEPIENAEYAEPTDPIENDEPDDAIEQNELFDHSDQPVRAGGDLRLVTSRSSGRACPRPGP